MASEFHHIAPAPGSTDLFATATFEHDVFVWSLRRRERLAVLRTILDFGGRRLCLVPSGRSWLVVAAAYHVHGVCAYHPTGRVLWERRDLKRAQVVTTFQDDGGRWLLAVGKEDGPLAVLDALTG
jgi:hypothetical protein